MERWLIQWVREYKQFIVEPPAKCILVMDDEWMETSFNTIAEAMDWIEYQLTRAPAEKFTNFDPHIEQEQIVLYTGPVEPVAEPPRTLDYSERMRGNRQGVVNPISDQNETPSRRERLEDYSQMVGLQ